VRETERKPNSVIRRMMEKRNKISSVRGAHQTHALKTIVHPKKCSLGNFTQRFSNDVMFLNGTFIVNEIVHPKNENSIGVYIRPHVIPFLLSFMEHKRAQSGSNGVDSFLFYRRNEVIPAWMRK